MLLMPDGTIKADKTLNDHPTKKSGWWKKNGAKPIVGFQLRYIYFLNPEAKKRLTVPILPFSKIDEMGAGMYKGKPKRLTGANSGVQPESGGSTPTQTLQSIKGEQ